MNNSEPVTPFDGLTSLLGASPSWFFPIVSILSLAATLFYSLHNIDSAIILIPLSATIGLVPHFVKKGAAILYDWKEEVGEFLAMPEKEITKLYSRRFEKFSNVRVAVLAGITLTFIACGIYYGANSFLGLSVPGKIISWAIFCGSTFVCGVGVVSIVHLVLFFRDIGAFPVEVNNTSFGIMSSGSKLLRCFSLGFIAWFLYSLSGFGRWDHSTNPLLYLSLPSCIFLVGSFVFAQYPLHNRMVEYKKKQILKIQKLIKNAYPKESGEVNKKQLELLSHLLELSKEASQLPVWPFNFGTLVALITGALGAVSPTFISIGIKYYFG